MSEACKQMALSVLLELLFSEVTELY